MKSIARGVTFWVLLLASLASASLAPPAAGQTSPQSLKQRLVGHWQLASVTANGSMPYGANPEGTMFLDAGGHFAVIVISAGNARSVAYFGTYAVDDAGSSVTFHVENSSGGSGASVGGKDIKRVIAFNGNELTISSQAPSGGPGPIKLTWTLAN